MLAAGVYFSFAAFALFLFMIVVAGVLRRSEPSLKLFLLTLRPMSHFCTIFVLSLAITWHWHENCVVIAFVIVTDIGVENTCLSFLLLLLLLVLA